MTGISTSVISRMEIGRGGGVPLETWLVLDALLPVDAFRPAAPAPAWGVDAVIGLATVGGWVAHTVDPNPILRRAPRLVRGPFRPRMTSGCLAVVHVVDVLTDILVSMPKLGAARETAARMAPPGWRAGGLLVVRRTEFNKRRARVRRFGPLQPGQSGRWIATLRDPDVAMPETLGFVWMDPRATRLIPTGLWLRGVGIPS